LTLFFSTVFIVFTRIILNRSSFLLSILNYSNKFVVLFTFSLPNSKLNVQVWHTFVFSLIFRYLYDILQIFPSWKIKQQISLDLLYFLRKDKTTLDTLETNTALLFFSLIVIYSYWVSEWHNKEPVIFSVVMKRRDQIACDESILRRINRKIESCYPSLIKRICRHVFVYN
jgi:hypothetical protein